MMFSKLQTLMSSPRALRKVLWLDAASAALTGVLHLLAGGTIVDWTALPAGLVEGGGIVALLATAGIVIVVSRAALSAPLLRLVVLGNAMWVAACTWLPVSGLIAPNGVGQVYVGLLGAVVAGFTLLEYAGLRALARATPGAPQRSATHLRGG